MDSFENPSPRFPQFEDDKPQSAQQKRRLSKLVSNTSQKLNNFSSRLSIGIRSTRSPSTSPILDNPSSYVNGKDEKLSGNPITRTLSILNNNSNSNSNQSKKILGCVSDSWPMYSNSSTDYELGQPIGFGASSLVRLARFKPLKGELCAVKVIDIDRLSLKQIDYLRKETMLMSLAKHPNILRVRGEWIDDTSLFIAVRLMKAGSLSSIMNYKFQDGLPEVVIATILSQALAGLIYLHQNHWIHRDIKAANLLVDRDGTILVADFGVSVGLHLDYPVSPIGIGSFGDDLINGPTPRKHYLQPRPMLSSYKKPSFVGTVLYMAPEVIERKPYNDRVDIWSFGITALELALGKAPNSFVPTSQVLIKTVTDPSPSLERRPLGGPNEYSRSFRSFVDQCLQKDPMRRPSSEELMVNNSKRTNGPGNGVVGGRGFLSKAKDKKYLISSLLEGLPDLENRQERRSLKQFNNNQNEKKVLKNKLSEWDFSTH